MIRTLQTTPPRAAALFVGALSLFVGSLASARQAGDAPRLDAELLFGHPALVSGDDAAVRNDLLRALEATPDAPLALEAVLVFDWHGEGVTRAELERLSALTKRLVDAAALHEALAILRRDMQRWRFSDAPFEPALPTSEHTIANWSVVGPLGALDHRAPAAMDAPSSSPELAGAPDAPRYTAADGRPREWVPCRLVDAAAQFVHPTSVVYPTGGVTYAAAFVKPSVNVDRAVLELRTTGAFRAWWNGDLVREQRRETAFEREERFLADVEVHSGWNVLLVRLVTSEDAPLAARLLDARGAALALVDAPEGALWTVPWRRSTSAPRALPSRRLGAEPADGVFGPALAMARALFGHRPDLALAVPPPDDPRGRAAWRLVRLRALNAATHLPDEVERRAVLDLLDVLEREGPTFALARSARVRQLQREDRPVEALQAADAWVAAAPEAALPRLARASCLGQLDRYGVLRRLALEEVVLAHPEHAGARAAYAQALQSSGDEVGALEQAWGALLCDATEDSAASLVIELSARCGDSTRLEFLLARTQAWLAANPINEAARAIEVHLLENLGRLDDVLARAREASELAPQEPDRYWAVGEALLRRGDLAGARAMFARELALDPADPTTRATLRLLGDEDPAERFFSAFAPDVDAALRRAESVTDASVVEALDSGLIYYFPDGSSHARFHTLSVPRDRKGTEELHVHPVEEGTLLARIRARDGRELEPIEVDGQWTLPALEPGDAVEFIWDVEAEGTPGAPPIERGWRFSSFEKAFPTSRWVIFVPTGLPGRLDVRNFTGTHEEVPWDGGTVHVLFGSYPRQLEEVARPSDIEILPVAAYSGDRQRTDELLVWEGNLRALSSVPADLDADLRAYAQEHTGVDTRATAEAIYRALDQRTRDHRGGSAAGHVWLMQRGLPLFLLAALYERAGVPFEWALLERGVAPEIDPEPVAAFAGQRALERPVLRLGVNDEHGDPLWLIPFGSPGFSFGAIPESMAGARAFVRGAQGWRDEQLPRTQLDAAWNADVTLEYTLEADGAARVQGRLVNSAAQGDVLRRQLREATAEQREGFARQQVNSVARGLDIASVRFDLDAATPGMVLLFEGRIPRFATGRGDSWTADPPFLALGLDSSFGPAQRRWPLAFRSAQKIRVRATLELGEHWRVVGGPSPTREERTGLVIEVERASANPSQCALSQRYEQRGLYVPAAEMPAFLARMGELEAEFRRPLRLERVE